MIINNEKALKLAEFFVVLIEKYKWNPKKNFQIDNPIMVMKFTTAQNNLKTEEPAKVNNGYVGTPQPTFQKLLARILWHGEGA